MKIFIILAVATLTFCKPSPEEGKFFEGDMELDPDQISAVMEQRSKNNQFASINAFLWMLNGKPHSIRYYIDPQIVGATSAIRAAVADYHKFTCLKFIESSSRPYGPHIFFTVGNGCSSPVGRRWTADGNSIRLHPGCWHKGTIMHEMGHSIGLFHEQSRPDRDNFVTINHGNIDQNYQNNFLKISTNLIDSRNTAYDYDSMMHYGGKFFSINGQLTIQTKNPVDQGRIGQRKGFSPTDITQINRMYCGSFKCFDNFTKCPDLKAHCTTSAAVRQNCLKSCNIC